MKFSELIEHCVTCIKTFNPVIKTIDSHADEMIAQVSHISPALTHPLQFTDPYEKVFVKQSFYGCVRYQEFLKVCHLVDAPASLTVSRSFTSDGHAI